MQRKQTSAACSNWRRHHSQPRSASSHRPDVGLGEGGGQIEQARPSNGRSDPIAAADTLSRWANTYQCQPRQSAIVCFPGTSASRTSDGEILRRNQNARIFRDLGRLPACTDCQSETPRKGPLTPSRHCAEWQHTVSIELSDVCFVCCGAKTLHVRFSLSSPSAPIAACPAGLRGDAPASTDQSLAGTGWCFE